VKLEKNVKGKNDPFLFPLRWVLSNSLNFHMISKISTLKGKNIGNIWEPIGHP
jgi:hypothetical protein